jgi:hypothetical protein
MDYDYSPSTLDREIDENADRGEDEMPDEQSH